MSVLQRGGASWPVFLTGDDPQQVLWRLSQGDPLRLRERSARRLRETWFLLDPDRTYYRSLAVCSQAAGCGPAPAELEAWAAERIDDAIAQLVNADREAEREGLEEELAADREFPLLTESLLLAPERVRPATVAFNALLPLPRRAFFELLIEGCSVEECVERGPWDSDQLYDCIQRSLAALALNGSPDYDLPLKRSNP